MRERIRGELLEIMLRDNVKARFLQAGGSYTRPRRRASSPAHRSQTEFIQLARAAPSGEAAAGQNDGKYPRFKLAPNPFSAKPG